MKTNDKIKILKQFDECIRTNIDDEEILNYWSMMGVSDGTDIDILIWIATDEQAWLNCVEAFADCCKMAGILD